VFKDQRYAYTVLVTNLELDPWRVWTFYRHGQAEKKIAGTLYERPWARGKVVATCWANGAELHTGLKAGNRGGAGLGGNRGGGGGAGGAVRGGWRACWVGGGGGQGGKAAGGGGPAGGRPRQPSRRLRSDFLMLPAKLVRMEVARCLGGLVWPKDYHYRGGSEFPECPPKCARRDSCWGVALGKSDLASEPPSERADGAGRGQRVCWQTYAAGEPLGTGGKNRKNR